MFNDARAKGKSCPGYMTAERLLENGGSVWAVRAFLYHSIGLRDLYRGDGFSWTHANERGVAEYLTRNYARSEIVNLNVESLAIALPE